MLEKRHKYHVNSGTCNNNNIKMNEPFVGYDLKTGLVGSSIKNKLLVSF